MAFPTFNDNDNHIYVTELGKIINRRPNTIHKWDNYGVFPEHLRPRRGICNGRYWTREQVYGPDGIIAWLKATDRRSGKNLADPANEISHLEHMRHPRFITKNNINSVLCFLERGWGPRKIAETLLPRTRYKNWQRLDLAIRTYFAQQGWPYPAYDEHEQAVQKLIRKFNAHAHSGDDEGALEVLKIQVRREE